MATCSGLYQPATDDDRMLQRDALVMKHLPQVRLIARRIHESLPPNVSLDDLISTGVLGLIAAVDNFDPTLNVQLNTYAERRIRGAILDSLRDSDWASRETRKRARQIETAIRSAKQRLGREPSEEEIASELQIPLDEYQKRLGSIQGLEVAPLDFASAEGESGSLLQFLADDEEKLPSRVLERAELERILAAAIDRLPKQERTVLSLYYYEGMTLNEIAEIVKCHKSRAAQLRVQGILRLRSHLERVWSLETRRHS